MKYLQYFLIVFVLTSVVTFTPRESEAGLIREAGRGCLLGGTVVALTTTIGITPGLLYPVQALAGSSILLNNALIGCGIFAAGMAVGSVWETIYGFFF